MIYAVGDIHGCHDQLLVLLAKIKFHAKSKPYQIIFLGDYVDRGPKSRRVVNQVCGLVTGNNDLIQCTALKGNHEEMMVHGVNHADDTFWYSNGGLKTVESYIENGVLNEGEMKSHANWLSTLPTYFETDNYVFVHAGLSSRYSIRDQPDEVRLWIRGWERDDHDFGKHVVYGHTPGKTPNLKKNSSGLDTGAVYWGTLTAGVFDPGIKSGPVELIQAE